MINDQTLILYYYEDGISDRERERVRRALGDDAVLKARYDALCDDLRALGDVDSVDVPPGVEARWHRALEDEAQIHAEPRRFAGTFPPGFALAAALSLVFIGGLFLGVRLHDAPNGQAGQQQVAVPTPRVSPPESARTTATPARPRAVFVRGVAAHLERTQIQLASIDLDDSQQRSELVDAIVSQNRFFLTAAQEQGADDVARLLRAFEPLLLSMAEESSAGRTPVQIRQQLDFELGATLTKFNWQTSNKSKQF